MEELTKSQIVLLTLLVSFVTSIATGIVTVALIDQAPPGVTQTVSHIIRETVQNAVPAVISQSAAVAQPPKPPDAAPEPDLSQLLARAEQSIVRLYSGTSGTPIFLGLGVVLDAHGTVITDSDALGSLKKVHVVTTNGSSTQMKIVSNNTQSGFLYLSPISTSTAPHFAAASLASADASVGDTIVAISVRSTLRIASGLVVGVGTGASQSAIFTNFSSDSIVKGMTIINEKGEFVGMSTRGSRDYESTAFTPIPVSLLLSPEGIQVARRQV